MARGSAWLLAPVLACTVGGCGRVFYSATARSDAGAATTDAGVERADATQVDAPTAHAAADAGTSVDASAPIDATTPTDSGSALDAGGARDAALPPCDSTPRHYAWPPSGGGGVALAWSGSTFLLAFNDGADTLHARVLDATGTELAAETLVSPSSESGAGPPAAMWDGSAFLVVWISHADRTVRGRFLTAGGTLDSRPEAVLSTTTGPYTHPNVVAVATGYFVGVVKDLDGGAPVYIQLDETLAPVGEHTIAPGPASMYPEEGCPVAWSGERLAAATVDTALGPPRLSVSTRRADGTLLVSTPVVGDTPNNSRLGIACRSPSDCAVAWGGRDVRLVAFPTPLTTPTDHVVAAGAGAGGLDVATDGTRYVVVWNDLFSQAVEFAVLSGATPAALAVALPPTMVSEPGRRGIWPSVAWMGTGTSFAVAWRDESGPGQSFARLCF